MSINMAEFHQVFFEESHEHLENMEQLLIALDIQSPDPEELNTIFRAAHSIKGGSGIFGFTALTSVTHVMENLLDKIRKGTFELSSGVIDLLLKTVDTLSHILSLYRQEAPIDWQQVEFAKNQLVAALNGESFSAVSPKDLQTPVIQAITTNSNQLEEARSNQAPEEDMGFGFFEEDVELSLAVENQDFGFFDEAYTAKEIGIDSLSQTNVSPEPISTAADDNDLGFGFFESLTPDSIDSELDALVQVQTGKTPPAADSITAQMNHVSASKLPQFTGKNTEKVKAEASVPANPIQPLMQESATASKSTQPQTVAKKITR